MITIREFKKEDALAVSVLIPQLTKNIVEPEGLVKRLEDLSVAQNWQYLVAELEDKVVGFAGLVWYPIPSKGMIGWIEEVVVDESARGHGIGKLLMLKLLELAEAKKCVRVRLTTQNPIARQLYESLGFIKGEENYFVKK